MRLLLDTHIVVWTALDPKALSETERRWMADADGPLVLSAVAVWELRLKWHSFHITGGRKGPVDPASVLAFAAAMDWEFLPLTARHAAAVSWRIRSSTRIRSTSCCSFRRRKRGCGFLHVITSLKLIPMLP